MPGAAQQLDLGTASLLCGGLDPGPDKCMKNISVAGAPEPRCSRGSARLAGSGSKEGPGKGATKNPTVHLEARKCSVKTLEYPRSVCGGSRAGGCLISRSQTWPGII